MKKVNVRDLPVEDAAGGALHKKFLIREGEASSDLFFIQEVLVDPKSKFEPHLHVDMEEYYYFLQGQGIMQVGDEFQKIEAGDRVIIPINLMHRVENTGQTPIVFLAVGVKAKKD